MRLKMREGSVVEQGPKVAAGGGLHLLGEWLECAAPRALLEDAARLRRLCLVSASDAGLRVLGHLFQQGSPAGVAGAILLVDSHLTIRTRPDDRSVTLDVFVGGQARNHRFKARALYGLIKERFMPEQENVEQIG
ncbi:MAG: S-adenosylmethionine decarboxylase [Burkholderiales bacterium]